MTVRSKVPEPRDDTLAVLLARLVALKSAWAEFDVARRCFGVESSAAAVGARAVRVSLISLSQWVATETEASMRVVVDDLAGYLDAPAIVTDARGRHWDREGVEHEAVTIDGELTFKPLGWLKVHREHSADQRGPGSVL